MNDKLHDVEPDEKHFPAALREAIGFVRVVELDRRAGSCIVAFEGRPAFAHSGGSTIQGGIVTAWIDHAMAWAVAAQNPKVGVATLEIKTSFLARTKPGPVQVHARVAKWGRLVVFLEAEVRDADGKLTATATSTGVLSPG